ncbi:PLDc N-terminal domain-containing protein [Rhodococcus sp. 06-1460-1B]|uniref:PLDc N-terminal domain-containing protein n=1 Tax=Rhodococcus sp. 06-1460-1B TaxID=2022501 RepID=UPI000B9B3ECA|nr:PLDc N-terminal domain-containing protein [Rhodococcus sp. 06-1460-1B]MBX5333808.1 PLDc N-terminal domain-containing protein [Rhodococcus fascians]MBY4059984.1 PLDc N-terminal domain-containing protein [Rhodococcus fascians]MBY4070232.1 PLDc N-terminal domain-containing protein [Rhodococcus fascians]MBY4277093.1 PLDc N-terminal domain-containing protein [Rhodococcus fascians]MBY4434267.1 PLDc N-terminal domain-containing protein [Rhodococcus fascians]
MTSAGGAIALALFGMALVSIVLDTGTGWLIKLAWVVVAVILPIVGPILWFAVGKRYPYGVNGGNN